MSSHGKTTTNAIATHVDPSSSCHAAQGSLAAPGAAGPSATRTLEGRPLQPRLRAWVCLAAIGCSLLATLPAARAQGTATAAPVPATPAAEPAAPDLVAARFLTSCAGCHTLTDAKLNGPGLLASTTWPVDQLKTAIKRMEKNVGPLTDEELTALADFIKDGKAKTRLAAEQEKLQARFLAKLAPPDAALGAGLFTGSQGFRHGGLACAACHSVAGAGGNLGPDLTGCFVRMGGKTPLISAIEKANFKIMAPHYQRHPITTQEAIHLTEYLSKIDPTAPAAAQPPFALAGAGLAGLLLAGLTVFMRRQRLARGRDNKLTRRRN